MSDWRADAGIDEHGRVDATRQWKRELHAMVAKRDERIAELEGQLVEMTLSRDHWRANAESASRLIARLTGPGS